MKNNIKNNTSIIKIDNFEWPIMSQKTFRSAPEEAGRLTDNIRVAMRIYLTDVRVSTIF